MNTYTNPLEFVEAVLRSAQKVRDEEKVRDKNMRDPLAETNHLKFLLEVGGQIYGPDVIRAAIVEAKYRRVNAPIPRNSTVNRS